MRHPLWLVALLAIAPAAAHAESSPLSANLHMADWLKKKNKRARRTASLTPSQSTSSRPAAAKKKSVVKVSKTKWVGGPRPNISGSAPSTVRFRSRYSAGTVIIDTSRRRLFYVLAGGRALSYPIAVGRIGFQWTGSKKITRVKNWPDWRPPAEMRKRKPNLPKIMTGGIYNPLGAKALYLSSSLYRIHGTANAKSIGTASSSGCFRMHNKHVVHLAKLAKIGTRVVVLRRLPRAIARSISGKKSG